MNKVKFKPLWVAHPLHTQEKQELKDVCELPSFELHHSEELLPTAQGQRTDGPAT